MTTTQDIPPGRAFAGLGRLPRWQKITYGTAALAIVLMLGAGAVAAASRPAKPSAAQAAGVERWCRDRQWAFAGAQLYNASFGGEQRPVTPQAIASSLQYGGRVRFDYQQKAAHGEIPADVGTDELQAYLTAVASAEAAGTAPLDFGVKSSRPAAADRPAAGLPPTWPDFLSGSGAWTTPTSAGPVCRSPVSASAR